MEGMKSYGWGIVDKDGCPVWGMHFKTFDRADQVASGLQKTAFRTFAPYKPVELFYKDAEAPVGEILTLAEMKAILYGDEQS